MSVYGTDNRRLRKSRQFDNFAISFVLVKDKVNGKVLALLVDKWSAVSEASFRACNFLSGLGTFDDKVAFVFGESEQNVRDELAGWRVIYQSHVKDVNSNTALEQVADEFGAFSSGASKAVELGDNDSVAGLQALNQSVKLRAFGS